MREVRQTLATMAVALLIGLLIGLVLAGIAAPLMLLGALIL